MSTKRIDYVGPLLKGPLKGFMKRGRGRPREVMLDPKALLRDIAKILETFPTTTSDRAIARWLQSPWADRKLQGRYKNISYRTLRRNIAEMMSIVRDVRIR